MITNEPAISLKILIVGESGVGKSSLLLRFVDGRFDLNSHSTIGVDYKTKMVNVDGTKVRLALWDTAGQERFRALTQSFYRGAHGVIFVYDITKRHTYIKLHDWLSELESYGDR